MVDEPVRLLAEEDLARPGRLLEPGGDVQRVGDHDGAAGDWVLAGCDLAGVDPDPHLDPGAMAPFEIGVQAREPGTDLGHGAHGAQRVVLACDGDAEDRDHRVTDELLHGSAMGLDRRARLVEIPKHEFLAPALGHARPGGRVNRCE
jgi:hypothetical protein